MTNLIGFMEGGATVHPRQLSRRDHPHRWDGYEDDDDDNNDGIPSLTARLFGFHSPTSQANGVYLFVKKFSSQRIASNFTAQRHIVRFIEMQCMQHPEDLAWQDRCGNTALHLLAQSARMDRIMGLAKIRFLVSIAKMIVDADPELLLRQNKWNETPLFQFVAHCGLPSNLDATATFDESHSHQLVKLLRVLRQRGAHKIRNSLQRSPLQEAIRLVAVKDSGHALLCTAALASSSATDWNTPHRVDTFSECVQAHYHAVIRTLIFAARSMCFELGLCKETPVSSALVSDACNLSTFRYLLESQDLPTGNERRQQLDCFRHSQSEYCARLGGRINWMNTTTTVEERRQVLQIHYDLSVSFRAFWAKLKAVIRFYHSQDDFLHGLVKVGAPSSLLIAALLLQDDVPSTQASTAPRSKHTLLTFFLFLRGISSSAAYPSNESCDIIRLMLRLRKDSKSLAQIPNPQGRYPLVAALVDCCDLGWASGIKNIFDAYRAATSHVDPVTRLHPFQLAALYTDPESFDQPTQLSASYELLRADPSVLVHCIQNAM